MARDPTGVLGGKSHSEKLVGVDLYINAECNLACTTCFLGDGYFTGKRMSTSDVSDILAWAAQNDINEVAFLGGEPTLHPDLAHMLAEAQTLGFERIRLVTNGSARFRRLLRSGAGQCIDSVYLSLDGHNEMTHDAVRGSGSFMDVMKSMDLLASEGTPFVVTMTVTRSSLDSIWGVLQMADLSGAEAVNIHWLSPVGRATDPLLAPSPEEWHEACQAIETFEPLRSDLHIYYQPAFVRANEASENESNLCAVRSRSNLQFMPEGQVHSCGLTVDRPKLAGHVWRRGALRRVLVQSELDICDGFDGPGCPLRPSGSSKEADRWLPVCIYSRRHSHFSRGS